MKERSYLILVLSHALIGVGFFFFYTYFVRSVFESRTHFSTLTRLERESFFRKDDALYISFYKTIVEESDFYQGYEKLLNVTTIEYPNSVNVLKRFHVLPEVVIGYFFHSMRRFSRRLEIPILTCWALDDRPVTHPQITCSGIGEPHQFYLEFVWILGGFTIFIIYMYGTFLSESMFGGIYAVASYIIFHRNASKIYERPAARENFAFPFILWQIFYLSLYIERVGRGKIQRNFRPVVILKFTLLTTISLLFWQFSSIIFATQILIMIMPWSLGVVSSSFFVDYAISQFLGNIIAYYMSYGNKKYFFSWQNGPALALLVIGLVRVYKTRSNTESSIKSISLGILLAVSSQGTIIDLLEKSGYARPEDNPFLVYRDLIFHWTLQRKVNFTTKLLACNSEFTEKDVTDLWELIKTMFVKPYCLYGVVVLAKFFRKWRKKGSVAKNTTQADRAMKYVLEDFLEENHISMQEINNIESGKELGDCWKLLEQCDFDYNKYKLEKSKVKKDKINDHDAFFDDIKKLKKQINAIKLEKTKKSEHKHYMDSIESTIDARENENQNSKELSKKTEGLENNDDVNSSSNSFDEQSENNPAEKSNGDSLKNETKHKEKQNSLVSCESLGYHYIYSLSQLAIFTAIGLNIRKLFFLCFTQGCVITPTICCKLWHRKQRHVFWAISFAVFVTSIIDPGLVNIHDEYFPSKLSSDSLESMLEWINMNTEADAVFGGPIEVIGTVHLATKRRIVNHAHLEMPQITDRTEYVYSVLSRQQSSDIYNQCSQLKIQYLIVSFKDCNNSTSNDNNCDIMTIWDEMQPAYRKYPQFCAEILYKNVPSFLKVYANDQYAIIKMFSQSLQINLKYSKMPEKYI